jgi:succinyl-CoA synthetase beta subunit
MKIHEYQAREIFKQAGIPVTDGGVAETVEQARALALRIGFPVVLKAQVLTGGRGKAGGVKVVKDIETLTTVFAQIKGLNIKGYEVERIFVVKAVDIRKEFYTAVITDPVQNDVVLIASAEGGVDIEETAKVRPHAIHKFYLNRCRTVDQPRLAGFVAQAFSKESDAAQAVPILQRLIEVFFRYDCSLAEINPLVIEASGAWMALDAKINFDDNALYRQPDVQGLRDMKYEDPDELEAKDAGLSFVKLDGNVGCVVNGAGLAMATMDVVKLMGGDPANFLDVGGSSNPQKVLTALKIILRNPQVKAILINIFGGITRCDDIAQGLLAARRQLALNVPLVVRLTGTNEEEAKALLAQQRIETYSTMREAVQKVVSLAKD